MKINWIFFVGFLLIFFSSCQRLVLRLMGVRQPQIENDHSIISFMKDNGVESGNVYHIDSAASYKYMENLKIDKTVNIHIYNGSGQLLKKMADKECSGVFSKALATIDLPSLNPVVITTKSLDEELQYYRMVDKSISTLGDFNRDDFIVTITWMKCFGSKTFKQNACEWTKQLKMNPSNDKIKILYFNGDMHQSWGLKSKNDDRYLIFEF